MRIKVHRVASVDEAALLEASGVDVIGLEVVDPDAEGPSDGRGVSEYDIWRFAEALTTAQHVVTMPRHFLVDSTAEGAQELEMPWFQLPQSERDDDFLAACVEAGIRVSYAYDYIPDDDPLPAFKARSAELAGPSEVHVFPASRDPWSSLLRNSKREASAGSPLAMTLENLRAWACRHPLFVRLPCSPTRLQEQLQVLDELGVAGVTFVLGTECPVATVLEALKAIGRGVDLSDIDDDTAELEVQLDGEHRRSLAAWAATIIGGRVETTWVHTPGVDLEVRAGDPGQCIIEVSSADDDTTDLPLLVEAAGALLAHLEHAQRSATPLGGLAHAIRVAATRVGADDGLVGRFVGGHKVEEVVASNAVDNLLLARAPDGSRVLLSVCQRSQEARESLAERLRFPGAPFLKVLGHGDVYLERWHPSVWMAEALPPDGTAITGTITEERAIRLGTQVAQTLADAAENGHLTGTLHPMTVWATGTRLDGLTPRPAYFFLSSDHGDMGVTPIFREFYMAPEFLDGLVTRESATFLVAMLIWRWVTGVSPFPGHNATSGLLAIATSEPGPFPGSERLGEVLAAGLAKSPSERPPPAEFAARLRRLIASG